jgi:hypothetical protein
MRAHHPAARARNFTGAVSALALVAMVTGFQFAAASESQNAASPMGTTPTPSAPASPGEAAVSGFNQPESDVSVSPSAVTTDAQNQGSAVSTVPAPAVPDSAPPAPAPPAPDAAPAPPAPDPAPAPPSGTTAGS